MSDRTLLEAVSVNDSKVPKAYWAVDPDEAFRALGATPEGLSASEASKRLREFGRNELEKQQRLSRLRLLWAQVQNPLVLLLLFAAAASALTREWVDSVIVFTIVMVSVGISYSREFKADAAVAALRACVHVYTKVRRDGAETMIPVEDVVPGDVVLLSAGSLVPADALVLEAIDCFTSEAMLTGESFPVRKKPGRTLIRRAGRRSQQLCFFWQQCSKRGCPSSGICDWTGYPDRRHLSPDDAATAGDRI